LLIGVWHFRGSKGSTINTSGMVHRGKFSFLPQRNSIERQA